MLLPAWKDDMARFRRCVGQQWRDDESDAYWDAMSRMVFTAAALELLRWASTASALGLQMAPPLLRLPNCCSNGAGSQALRAAPHSKPAASPCSAPGSRSAASCIRGLGAKATGSTRVTLCRTATVWKA